MKNLQILTMTYNFHTGPLSKGLTHTGGHKLKIFPYEQYCASFKANSL